MKKLVVPMTVLLLLGLVGCKSQTTVTQEPVDSIAEIEIAELEPIPEIKPEASYDVDLTTLSSTMVYAEVYNMMVNYHDYVGKIVKAEGIYASFLDETTDMLYCAVIIQDATACCAQGLEFVLTDDYAFPDDYPSDGEIVTVVGQFSTYTSAGAPDMEFVHLTDAEFIS